MNSGNLNEGPGSSANGGNNSSGPNRPNRGGGFGKDLGCNPSKRFRGSKKHRWGDGTTSTMDEDKLLQLRGVSYNLLNKLESGRFYGAKYFEIRQKLIENEIKRTRFIEGLPSDRLRDEFSHDTTRIARYFRNEFHNNK